jgi:hypothetical protein
MECFRTGTHFSCDVRRLFYQLQVPPQEQIVLMNMAGRKKVDCESFKSVLSKINQIKIKQS